MAIAATPNNFFVQNGNMQAFCSWDIVSGAISYDVQRSTDGVNFSSVASPTVGSFLDTTVLINTAYWYKVASVNASGTSPYTTAAKTTPTLPGKIGLGQLRARAQEKADKVNSKFIKLPEWNFFINESYYELYNLLIGAFEDYYVSPRLPIVTDGITQLYDLPNGLNYSSAPAIYKLYGVDLGLNNSPNAWVTLKKFEFIQRNRYVFPQITSSLLGVFNLQYRLMGDKIMFIPIPSAGQTIGLWYYPRLTTLLQDTDVMDGISGWENYVICRAAKYALQKEESSTQDVDAELAYIRKDIESMAQNRDVGQGDVISNVRTTAERWGGQGFDGSTGGW